jgi:hypothetical protein
MYCGMVLYLPNATAQSASLNGGIAPSSGFHSVIDKPEPVSRVAPPTATMRNTSAATASSQI